mmetsp:Transcript_61164/g.145674  ORF Transcript_61164/g.145674 Transcript_61164/m.145674 type:complete len:475 (-) Transcript_61164:204-1628(-)
MQIIGSRVAFAWIFLAIRSSVVSAGTFSFMNEPIPAKLSLHGWYMFTVYTKHDFEVVSGVQGEFVQVPAVQFELASQALGHFEEAESYKSLEASVIYYPDYMQHVDPESFCDSSGKAASTSVAKESLEWASMSIPVATTGEAVPTKVKVPLNRTGKYMLLLTNCGEFSDAVISGTVLVMNPYGYLAPEHYYKEGPLGIMMVAYVMLAAGFVAYGTTRKKQFYDVHFYLAGLMVISAFEAGSNLHYLSSANASGFEEPWSSVALILYVVKWIYLYFFSIYVAGGYYYRDTTETEVQSSGWSNFAQMAAPATFYAVVLTFREIVMYQRTGLRLSASMTLLFSAPTMFMDAALVMYLVSQTRAEFDRAEALHDGPKSQIYGKLYLMGSVCAAFGACAWMVQLLDIMGMYPLTWQTKWMPLDGVAHILCFASLATAAFAMRPGMVERKNLYGQIGVEDDPMSPGPQSLGKIEAPEYNR